MFVFIRASRNFVNWIINAVSLNSAAVSPFTIAILNGQLRGRVVQIIFPSPNNVLIKIRQWPQSVTRGFYLIIFIPN